MKKDLCIAGLLVLAAQLPLWGYDTSPGQMQVVPEAIWAAATGGGTWVTELQITSFSEEAINILADFLYTGGRTQVDLYTGLAPHCSLRFPNILAELQALDSSISYYGRVGALAIAAWPNAVIQIQAKTVNGNYGKTFPGLNYVVGNTAAVGRPMIIQDLVHSAAFRTSVGVFDASSLEFTAEFRIVDANNSTVGSPFTKTISNYGFLSFNPFTEAGVTSGTYENCWLYIEVTSGVHAFSGLMFYGSIANNYTNDTYALLAKQYGTSSSALPVPALMRR